MAIFSNKPVLDDETLKKMNQEFWAGKYRDLEVPPVIPIDDNTDPFGMAYEWLVPKCEADISIDLRLTPEGAKQSEPKPSKPKFNKGKKRNVEVSPSPDTTRTMSQSEKPPVVVDGNGKALDGSDDKEDEVTDPSVPQVDLPKEKEHEWN